MDWNMGKREREERFQNLIEEHKQVSFYDRRGVLHSVTVEASSVLEGAKLDWA